MQHTRQAWTVAALVIAILLIVAGVWYLVAPKTASASGTRLTATVQQGQVTRSVTATGNLEPLSVSNPTFAVSGTVASVNVALGQTVTVGQLLGTIDSTPLNAALATAQTALDDDEAILANAQSALTDAQNSAAAAPRTSASASASVSAGSSGQSVASAQQSVLTDEQKVSADQATVNQDTQNVADAQLKAPVAGLIVAISGAVGQQSGSNSAGSSSASKTSSAAGAGASGSSGVSSSTSSSSSSSGFVTIADTSTMIVPAEIAEADIASVSVGQVATVTFPAKPGVTATATVTAIAPEGTTSNSIVTYPTTITLESIPAGVRLGQTADVSITTKSSPADALYVPAAAITTVNGTSTVKVLSASGAVTSKQVKLGVAGTQGTQITSGLKAGETIVLGTLSATTTTGTGSGAGAGFGRQSGPGGRTSGFAGNGFRGTGGGLRPGAGSTGGN